MKSYLNLERVDFEPTTLIVGTFIPSWPTDDRTDWFYGRTHDANGIRSNDFWDVLPRLYGEPTLIDATTIERKTFCDKKKIALTDLISSIDDADPANAEHRKIFTGNADSALVHNFDDFDFVNIVQLLRTHPTIKNVYLTRGITEPFWRHLWNPVMHYTGVNKIHERKLMHPSKSASYQHEAYNIQNPENPMPLLEDYILMRWKQEWHF